VSEIEPTPAALPARRRRDRARTLGAVAVAVVATVFVVSNTQEVKIHWVFGTSRAPLIIALAVALVLGAALGGFAARRVRRAPKEPKV
jgi:uncharacterized integral membrane protein